MRITNADRPETIVWYMKHFGYRVIGHLKKLMSFGLDTVDEIIQDAIDVYDAGARMVHIHARDEKGRPTPEQARSMVGLNLY